MLKEKLILNALAFKDANSGIVEQHRLLDWILSKGYRRLEIRREYMRNPSQEIALIAESNQKAQLELHYSVADKLFQDTYIDQSLIQDYMAEAKMLNAKSITFYLGDYRALSVKDKVFLQGLCNGSLAVLIENDQSLSGGKADKIEELLMICHENNIKLQMTFDIGNWIWTGEDAEKNALKLKPYVSNIHVKDVMIKDGCFSSTQLDGGIVDWKYFLKFFNGKNFILEYPCGMEPFDCIEHAYQLINEAMIESQ
ncbi:sugar phosphate isomerase/epimerase family protein [Anoxynatronum sibiricum]|uniref:Sugar phosphate isomerase/epimerase n=2 Tax=Anoxynatronum TaxID=210622 RepID=A0AA45WSX7_9CLOT|nr:Sugar phosphate isomerase/epimerase [Anoxynatronum buryatiense]